MSKSICYFLVFLALSGLETISAQSFSSVFTEKGFTAIEQNDAIVLLQKDYHYILGINMQLMDVSSFQEIDSTKKEEKGMYLDTISSPFYRQISYQDVIEKNKEAIIINSSYFEAYELSTLLSYPIYDNGKWITSGSSKYGPTENPIDEYYGNIELLALKVGTDNAQIMPFSELRNPSDLVLVSQNHSDHPAKILANNRKTRFLLVTTFDENEDGKDEWLLFSTGYLGTIDDQANVLKLVNNERPIMTLDGGSSVFLYHPIKGVLSPVINKITTSIEGEEKENMLPHYLIFKRK